MTLVADAQRERALANLRRHYQEGRLDAECVAPAGVAGEQPVEQRGVRAADVEGAGGSG